MTTLETIDRDHLSAATGGRSVGGLSLGDQIRARVLSKIDALKTKLQMRLGGALPTVSTMSSMGTMGTMGTSSADDGMQGAPQQVPDRRSNPRHDP